jgi:peptidoglycan/LPS O-acetylase OafA/YrhL
VITTLPSEPAAPAATPLARYHLVAVDGLRGVAALYVVLHHAQLITRDDMGPTLLWLTGWMRHGEFGVAVFIVLSGYCLMLPAIRAGTGQIPGGVRAYVGRRARRILPPYYAAVALALFAHVAVRQLNRIKPFARLADSSFAGWTFPSLGAHLLLLHNLRQDWLHQIDPPLWTVATEWQIYFVFPLMLLPLWRRVGSLPTVALGFVVGLSPLLLLPHGSSFFWAAPWFVGLFSLGMAAAAIGFSDDPFDRLLRDRVPWAPLVVVSFAAYAVLTTVFAGWSDHHAWPQDAIAGAFTAALLVVIVNGRGSGTAAARGFERVIRGLETPAVTRLATFSYSLYLTHLPLLDRMDAVGRAYFGATSRICPLLVWLVDMPLRVAIAYLFAMIFEPKARRPTRRPPQAGPPATEAMTSR